MKQYDKPLTYTFYLETYDMRGQRVVGYERTDTHGTSLQSGFLCHTVSEAPEAILKNLPRNTKKGTIVTLLAEAPDLLERVGLRARELPKEEILAIKEELETKRPELKFEVGNV